MENKRDFKWIRIPKEIRLDEKINMPQKLLLIEIDSLDNERWCFASNAYFSKFFWISENQVSTNISVLKKLWYIYQDSFDGRQRILKSNIQVWFIANQIPELNKYKKQTSDKPKGRPNEIPIYNNIDNNTLNNIDNNKENNKKDSLSSEIIDIEDELWDDEKKLVDGFIDYQYNEYVSMRVIINKDKNYKQKAYKDYIKIRDIMVENWLEFEDFANILYYIVRDQFWSGNIHSIKKLLEKNKSWEIYWTKIHDLVIVNKEKNIMKNMSF